MGGRDPSDHLPDYRDVVRAERLTTYEALVEWARWMQLLGDDHARRLLAAAEARPRDAATTRTRAIHAREAIYRLFKAVVEGWPPPDADLDLLNRELRVARARQVLEPAPPPSPLARRRAAAVPVEAYRWAWDARDGDLDRMLWPIVTSAAELLASDDLDRIGQCPAVGCGWLFLDTSRSGRRQWCDMAVCGNAEKVRRFRERQREKQRGRTAGGARRTR
jgi:predicted RNA-binding Zn ribbon-like protein